MNQESREHLSSLMDGEVSQEAGRFLVRRLGTESGFRQTWARYHLIRDCLRHQDGFYAESDMASRVRLALSNEPEVTVKSGLGRRWLRPLAGLAAAASVAFVAVLAVSQGPSTTSTPLDAGLPQTVMAEPFVSPNIVMKTAQSQPVNLSGRSAQDSQKMNTYLLRHYEATEAAGGKGLVSFAPIVLIQVPSREDSEPQNTEKGIVNSPR